MKKLFLILMVMSFSVMAFAQLSIQVHFISPSVFGATDGSISATVAGGTTPYTYAWYNIANPQPGASGAIGITSTLSNIGYGTYTLWVTDNGGNRIPGMNLLTEPAPTKFLVYDPITHTLVPYNSGGMNVVLPNGKTLIPIP